VIENIQYRQSKKPTVTGVKVRKTRKKETKLRKTYGQRFGENDLATVDRTGWPTSISGTLGELHLIFAEMRKKYRLSTKSVAKGAGLYDGSYLARIEKGTERLTDTALGKLCRAYGITEVVLTIPKEDEK
jgi:hypothetical protein